MPQASDLDETRLADAVMACHRAYGRSAISDNAVARTEAFEAAIAAWEASASKPDPATEGAIYTAAMGYLERGAGNNFGEGFHMGVRWAESRPPRAETKGEPLCEDEGRDHFGIPHVCNSVKGEPPRSGMTKAQLAGLLMVLDHLGRSAAPLFGDLAAAIRAETPDAP